MPAMSGIVPQLTGVLRDLRGGLGGLPRPHLAVGRGRGVRGAERDPRRRLLHPGPAVALGAVGARGWGLVLSGESVGLLVTTLAMLRAPVRRPLVSGMLRVALVAAAVLTLGSGRARRRCW